METAASQFLKAVRGDRSQVAFARKLGYRGNPITDWENGRRYPTAAEALRACAKVGIDVSAAFARFHPTEALESRPRGAFEIAAWLDRLRGKGPLGEVAQRAGVSRFAASRWLSGKAKPRLPDFFRLVDAITGRVADLVAELVPIESVAALRARHAAALAARTLAFEEPWTEAVLRVLETTEYQALAAAEPGWIARRLGIDPTVERRCLDLLVRAAVVRKVKGRYQPAGSLTVDTRARPDAMRLLRGHWAQVSLSRALGPGPGDSLSYNVCSLSRADLERVRELLRATFREIRSIVAASEPSETAALVLLHLIAFDQPAGR
ncbi:MAG: DUF4423 domain-containing protein [Deltaproteobacteria bacterium]|nr:DUF4423 domain-containing protein [Deltaproteobacteria bacterium]